MSQSLEKLVEETLFNLAQLESLKDQVSSARAITNRDQLYKNARLLLQILKQNIFMVSKTAIHNKERTRIEKTYKELSSFFRISESTANYGQLAESRREKKIEYTTPKPRIRSASPASLSFDVVDSQLEDNIENVVQERNGCTSRSKSVSYKPFVRRSMGGSVRKTANSLSKFKEPVVVVTPPSIGAKKLLSQLPSSSTNRQRRCDLPIIPDSQILDSQYLTQHATAAKNALKHRPNQPPQPELDPQRQLDDVTPADKLDSRLRYFYPKDTELVPLTVDELQLWHNLRNGCADIQKEFKHYFD